MQLIENLNNNIKGQLRDVEFFKNLKELRPLKIKKLKSLIPLSKLSK